MNKTILKLLMITFFCSSCTQTIVFEKDYYERVTKIKFPNDYQLIATADNGECVTISILDLNRTDCRRFYSSNKFEPITDPYPITLMGIQYIDSAYQQLPDKSKLLRKWGHIGKTDWTYLIDTSTCRLYCEILYPD